MHLLLQELQVERVQQLVFQAVQRSMQVEEEAGVQGGFPGSGGAGGPGGGGAGAKNPVAGGNGTDNTGGGGGGGGTPGIAGGSGGSGVVIVRYKFQN